MMKLLLLSSLIASHAAMVPNSLRGIIEPEPQLQELGLKEQVKKDWGILAQQFEKDNWDVLVSMARQRFAFLRGLLKILTQHNIDPSIITDIARLSVETLGFPWSKRALENVVQTASLVNPSQPWEPVLDFLPKYEHAKPLFLALERKMNDRSVPSDEVLVGELLTHLKKKGRAEKWKKMSEKEKFTLFTNYVTKTDFVRKPTFDISLADAVLLNDILILHVWLKIGADVDEGTVTPLHIASYHGHEGVVAKLIDAGADVNKANDKGVTPLYIASRNGHEGVVANLIAAGANLDLAEIMDGFTPLIIASSMGNKGVVAKLVTAGADVSRVDYDGYGPLYAADSMYGSMYGHKETVELLIAAGADVNEIDFYGCFPWFLALLHLIPIVLLALFS